MLRLVGGSEACLMNCYSRLDLHRHEGYHLHRHEGYRLVLHHQYFLDSHVDYFHPIRLVLGCCYCLSQRVWCVPLGVPAVVASSAVPEGWICLGISMVITSTAA